MNEPGKVRAALMRARQAIEPISKTARNPHFGNAYAPLGEVLAAVLPALAAEGLVLTAGVVEGPALEVRIGSTEDDSHVQSVVPLIGASDMQKLGGAMTYAMRYGVGMLLALELDEDDDGGKASQPTARPAQAPQPVQRTQGGVRPAANPSPAPVASGGKGGAPSGKPLKGKECPSCHRLTVIRGKPEYGGGYLCWKKEGGCGAKFTDSFWETVDPSQAPRPDNRMAAPAGSGARADDVFPPESGDLDLSETF